MIFDIPRMHVPAIIETKWLKSLSREQQDILLKSLSNDVEYAKNMNPKIPNIVKQKQARFRNVQNRIFKLNKI